MAFSSALVFVTLNLLVVFTSTNGYLIRRFNYEARLYEHFSYDSRYIQYSRTEPDDWKNITALGEAKNFTFTSMICTSGPGAWLFYPDADYQMGNSQRYYLVVGEHCVRSDDIESIQPLGKMDELLTKGVLLFEQPQFASTHTTVNEAEGSGSCGSLIYTGPTSYLVEGGGQKICIMPGVTEMDYGYCLVPDTKTAFKLEGSVNVKENCGQDAEEKILIVNNCYATGVHEMYIDNDLTVDKLKEVCDGGGDDFTKVKFQIIMEMWGKRLGSDLINPPMDYRPEDQTKLQLLWTIMEIFKKACPAVDDVYTYLLGNLFSLHLKNYWKGGNETVIGDENWKYASDFMTFCAADMWELPVLDGNCRTADQFQRVPDSSTPDTASWFEIANGEVFDTVIEQMWLVINFAIPSCIQKIQYVTNDWTDMVLFFHQAFLDPLQELWAEPGEWLRIYTAVFHGFDVREEHGNFLDCLSAALQASPDYDPIGRPKNFRDLMMYKYTLPDHGEVTPTSTISKKKKKRQSIKAEAPKAIIEKRNSVPDNGIGLKMSNIGVSPEENEISGKISGKHIN